MFPTAGDPVGPESCLMPHVFIIWGVGDWDNKLVNIFINISLFS